MKNRFTYTLAALTIGLAATAAHADPIYVKGNVEADVRANVVDKRHKKVRRPVIKAMPATAKAGANLTIRGRWLPAGAWLQLGPRRIRPVAAHPGALTFAIPDDCDPRAYRAKLIWNGGAEVLGHITIAPRYPEPVVYQMPNTATLGKSLTITGRYLPAGAVLKLGPMTLRPRYSSATRLTFDVPARLAARSYGVKLVAGAYTKNLGRLTLIAPYYAPVITSVPSKAILGKQLVITGRYLPASAVLKIGGKLIRPSYATPNRLSFEIPAHLHARIYSMKLLMPGGNKNLGRIQLDRSYYRPVVTSSPRTVIRGKTVVITGHHLPADAILEIGGVSLRASWASATRLKFQVPRRLRSGHYRMKLVTAGHVQSLGTVRVRPQPRRSFWSFNFSAWFKLG